ncbi:conserved Plasmodium protein, unknown function [Plasmodium chabaudi adami]|uniref:Uncharacterized protein n=1 Tax=Plasmodium chabaudi adami TaxID=5826 RepID=A0A1D3S4B4_PLACE|nr:conserved Plasmodium protein, unknown function [Plasmodium chabaudi adami]
MVTLATKILYFTYGRYLGNFVFDTFVFFSNYLNLVCYVLKKISSIFDVTNYRDLCNKSMHSIKPPNFKGLVKESKNIHLFNVANVNDLEFFNSSILETETEINERTPSEFDDFGDDEYNFDFLNLVHNNNLDE